MVLPKESTYNTPAQYPWDGTYSSSQSVSSTEGIGSSVYRPSSPDCPVESIEQHLSLPQPQMSWSNEAFTSQGAGQSNVVEYEPGYGQWIDPLPSKAVVVSSANTTYSDGAYYTADCTPLSTAPQSPPELLGQLAPGRPRSESYNFTGFHSLDPDTKTAILDALSREGREITLSVV
jgi:hypothetical protein